MPSAGDEVKGRREMTRDESPRPDTPDPQSRRHSELLEQALRQPGVRELMAVYQNWRLLEDVARLQDGVVKRIVSESDNSGPMVRTIG